MASGLPVITSNTSSLAEIAGTAAITVDPTDTDAIADAIVNVASDEALRADLALRGLLRARAFSWTQTAKEMLAVYHRAAGVATAVTAPAPIDDVDSVPVKSMTRGRSL
jgi:glycosyltransferase involved in cell wall biosynthesis